MSANEERHPDRSSDLAPDLAYQRIDPRAEDVAENEEVEQPRRDQAATRALLLRLGRVLGHSSACSTGRGVAIKRFPSFASVRRRAAPALGSVALLVRAVRGANQWSREDGAEAEGLALLA